MVVEESSHEQAAIFSHRHGHKRIANLFAEMRMHVWMSRASSANEALYSGYERIYAICAAMAGE